MLDSERPMLLILGGTAEARALAAAAVKHWSDDLRVVTSLAGRTRAPAAVAGEVRTGGFGGAEAMAEALSADDVSLVVDATHPFAANISDNAARACTAAQIPRLLLHRPAWRAGPGDTWIEAADMAEAAALLPTLGRCCLVTTGVQELAALAGIQNMRFVVRLVERPAGPLPLVDAALVIARPPHDLASERTLIADHGIDILLTKNAGGDATAAKLRAAREAGIPVLMIRRPPPPAGDTVETAADALNWIGDQLGGTP